MFHIRVYAIVSAIVFYPVRNEIARLLLYVFSAMKVFFSFVHKQKAHNNNEGKTSVSVGGNLV